MTFHRFQPFIAQKSNAAKHRTSITTFYNINGTLTANCSCDSECWNE